MANESAQKPAETPKSPMFRRFFQFDRAKLNAEERTIQVAFSTESPVEREEYLEVLSHEAGDMDLTRLNDSHPLLLNHDMDRQIGVIEKAEIGPDKKGRALVRFGNSRLAEEIFQDVKNGIRKHMSVGYERLRVISKETVEGGKSLIRFAWSPFEVSIVPVPADTNAGIGRRLDATLKKIEASEAIAERSMMTDDCASSCYSARAAAIDALDQVESCAQVSESTHTEAMGQLRAAIVETSVCLERMAYWSEATSADAVQACKDCAQVLDAAATACRTCGNCENCRSECDEAVSAFNACAEMCRENAGVEKEVPKADGETGTRSQPPPNPPANVDTRQVAANGASSSTQINRDMNNNPTLDPSTANAPGGAAPAAPSVESIRNSTLEAERTRIANIRASCDMVTKNHPEGTSAFRELADKAIAEGTSAADFNAKLLPAIPGVRKATFVSAESLGMSRREVNEYSLLRGIQSCINNHRSVPEGLEGEVHTAMKHRVRAVEASGFWVPHDMLLRTKDEARRDLNVTTAGQGGNFVQTTIFTPIIELLRNRMVTQRLGIQSMAGLEGNVAIPRQTGAATAYSLAESATLTKSTQAIDQIPLSPHRVGATNDYTKQLLLQSSVDVENFIRDDLMKVVAIKWDKLILEGSGSGDEPTGVLHTNGIGSVTFGATPTYAKMVAFETALATANADAGRMAYVTTPAVKGVLKITPKIGSTFPIFIWENGSFGANGDGSIDGEINGYRAASTNQIANDLVAFGNWEDAIHALWGGYDVVVNPFSRDVDAVVRITVNTFGDVAVRHAASFCWSDDAGNQ